MFITSRGLTTGLPLLSTALLLKYVDNSSYNVLEVTPFFLILCILPTTSEFVADNVINLVDISPYVIVFAEKFYGTFQLPILSHIDDIEFAI